jgi:hypothetical protein
MGYPLVSGPRIMPLIWLAVWFARGVTVLTERRVRQLLCHKLNYAVVSVTRNAPALVTAIGTMARYNQTPWSGRWWDRLVGDWPPPQDQIDRLKADMAESAARAAEAPPAAEDAPLN